MLTNENIDNIKYQSIYTVINDKYRTKYPSSSIPPHRSFSSDFWEETIPLIVNYLISHGLKPEHKILDLGAGGLRSGLALIPYLNVNNYYAIDINKYLLEDGYQFEIIKNNLEQKFPLHNIKVTHDYNGEEFNVKMDYIWSFSLWTHLDKNECDKCLSEISKILKVGGIYLTTCFIVNNTEYNNICERVSDVVIRTSPNKDPYHHKLDDFIKMGNKYGFKVEYCGIGNCCPRKHDIVKFIKK